LYGFFFFYAHGAHFPTTDKKSTTSKSVISFFLIVSLAMFAHGAFTSDKEGTIGPWCEESQTGCIYALGYWKTHATYGPASYDATWAQLGEDTPFYVSGQSTYEVLTTSPAGNSYYALAHQYIAATLNLAFGASMPSTVQDAYSGAQYFFETYTPEELKNFLESHAVKISTSWIHMTRLP